MAELLSYRGDAIEGILCHKSLLGTDEQLLDDVERTAFQFFWEQANPRTGLVKDRAKFSGTDTYMVASIASTGFGLTALCIGDARGYMPTPAIRARVFATLNSVANLVAGHNGFYYHFVDWETGQRAWKCELSSIDTSLLLCGVLTGRQYFHNDSQIVALANKIYSAVQWPWMLNGGATLSMGWKPESGFLDSRWNHYCELMMIYLLGIGSPAIRCLLQHGRLGRDRSIPTRESLTFRQGIRRLPTSIRRRGMTFATNATTMPTISRIQ